MPDDPAVTLFARARAGASSFGLQQSEPGAPHRNAVSACDAAALHVKVVGGQQVLAVDDDSVLDRRNLCTSAFAWARVNSARITSYLASVTASLDMLQIKPRLLHEPFRLGDGSVG